MLYSLNLIANAQTASDTLKSNITPLLSTIITTATILCILVVIFGGYYYTTSAGHPEKLERAKITLKNAFIGFMLIIGASTLLSFMQNAYTQRPVQPISNPQSQVQEAENDCPLCEVINQSIAGFINGLIQSVSKPVLETLKQVTTATPLMAQNGSVFNLWMIMVAIADTLFLLVISLIGFRIMSASVVGFEDIDIQTLAPQIILVFIIANLSIFAIDVIITVSNAMILALMTGISNDIIWKTLGELTTQATTVNIGTLLFIAIAIILAIILFIYYLKRLIILYIGAILSPLVVLLWLLPSFRDISLSSTKMYISTIFVLFIQTAILALAAFLFSGIIQGGDNPLITTLLVIATLSVLLSTNRTMSQLTMMSVSGQGVRKLSGTLVRSVSHAANSIRQSTTRPAVSMSRIGSSATNVLSSQSAMATGATRTTGVTRQVSLREAATALTSKKSPSHEVVVSGGARKPDVHLTEIPVRKGHLTSKGEK